MLGKIFDRLTIIDYAKPYLCPNNQIKTKWLCLCICGKTKEVREDHLLAERIKSCGCFRKDFKRTHGLSKCQKEITKEEKSTYSTWDAMIQRCTNPKNKKYNIYGGRGIKVCDRWLESFENFLNDMGVKPSSNLSLDRVNVNEDYCPENCRWATGSEQAFNKRKRSTNTSGKTGVSWNSIRQKWEVRITVDNKPIFLGRYLDFEKAVEVRKEAEIKYFGKIKED